MRPSILLLTTGGTIACTAQAHGKTPHHAGRELLQYVPPTVQESMQITVQGLSMLDSTDITIEHQAHFARTLWHLRDRFDGFVMTHGTDTMAYTAAMLGRMLPHFPKPIWLTGAMHPMGEKDSDAPQNLQDALWLATKSPPMIGICFAGKHFRADEVFKAHTSAKDAFASIHSPFVDAVEKPVDIVDNPQSAPFLRSLLHPHICTLLCTPLTRREEVERLEGQNMLLLETYGAGGLPAHLMEAVQRLVQGGTTVCIRSQCPFGQGDVSAYAVGERIAQVGAIDMSQYTREDTLARMACGVLDTP